MQGLVVQTLRGRVQPPRRDPVAGRMAAREDVPAITGIDTRTLTRRLRERGTMQGGCSRRQMALDEAKNEAATVDMRRRGIPQRRAERARPLRRRRTQGARRRRGRQGQHRPLAAGARRVVIRAPWHADLAALAAEARRRY